MKYCQYCNQAYYNGEVCPQCGQWMVDMDPSYQPQYMSYDYGMTQNAAYQSYGNPPKKRTGLIAFLLLLVVALAATVAVLLVNPFGTTEKAIEKPTATEKAVVQSAWDYYAAVYSLLKDMQGGYSQAESPQSDDTFIDVSTEDGMQQWEEQMDAFGDAMGLMFTSLIDLAAYGNDDYLNSLDRGIDSLSTDYPAIVEAWENIRNNEGVEQAEASADDINDSTDSVDWDTVMKELDQKGIEFKNACAAAGFDTANWTTPS